MSTTAVPAEPVQRTASIAAGAGQVLRLGRAHLLDLRHQREGGAWNKVAPRTVPALAEAVSTGCWRVAVAAWESDGLVLITDPSGVAVGLHVRGMARGGQAQSMAARCVPPLLALFAPDAPLAKGRFTPERDWAIATRVHAIGLALVDRYSQHGRGRGGQRLYARPYQDDLAWAVLPENTAQHWREAGVADANRAEHYAADGWRPQAAAPWIDEAFNVTSASMFATAGWNPRQALALRRAVDAADTSHAEDLAARQAWLGTGLPPDTALPWPLACPRKRPTTGTSAGSWTRRRCAFWQLCARPSRGYREEPDPNRGSDPSGEYVTIAR